MTQSGRWHPQNRRRVQDVMLRLGALNQSEQAREPAGGGLANGRDIRKAALPRYRF